MRAKIIRLFRSNRGFISFILLMVVFRGAIADWNVVPTGSMNPTIVEGDRILVNKLAYDVNIPFTTLTLFQLHNPQRGDIVVFDSEKAGKRLVKRVVGVPGDVVVMRNNRLTINGESASYQTVFHQSSRDLSSTDSNAASIAPSITVNESIMGFSHAINLKPRYQSPLQNFGPVSVPTDTI